MVAFLNDPGPKIKAAEVWCTDFSPHSNQGLRESRKDCEQNVPKDIPWLSNLALTKPPSWRFLPSVSSPTKSSHVFGEVFCLQIINIPFHPWAPKGPRSLHKAKMHSTHPFQRVHRFLITVTLCNIPSLKSLLILNILCNKNGKYSKKTSRKNSGLERMIRKKAGPKSGTVLNPVAWWPALATVIRFKDLGKLCSYGFPDCNLQSVFLRLSLLTASHCQKLFRADIPHSGHL